jgi:hypothetical protein
MRIQDPSNLPLATVTTSTSTSVSGSITYVAVDCAWTEYPVTLSSLWIDFVLENESLVPANQKKSIKNHSYTTATTYNWSLMYPNDQNKGP